MAQFPVVQVLLRALTSACPARPLSLGAARELGSSEHGPTAAPNDQQSNPLAGIVIARGPPCPCAHDFKTGRER